MSRQGEQKTPLHLTFLSVWEAASTPSHLPGKAAPHLRELLHCPLGSLKRYLMGPGIWHTWLSAHGWFCLFVFYTRALFISGLW